MPAQVLGAHERVDADLQALLVVARAGQAVRALIAVFERHDDRFRQRRVFAAQVLGLDDEAGALEVRNVLVHVVVEVLEVHGDELAAMAHRERGVVVDRLLLRDQVHHGVALVAVREAPGAIDRRGAARDLVRDGRVGVEARAHERQLVPIVIRVLDEAVGRGVDFRPLALLRVRRVVREDVHHAIERALLQAPLVARVHHDDQLVEQEADGDFAHVAHAVVEIRWHEVVSVTLVEVPLEQLRDVVHAAAIHAVVQLKVHEEGVAQRAAAAREVRVGNLAEAQLQWHVAALHVKVVAIARHGYDGRGRLAERARVHVKVQAACAALERDLDHLVRDVTVVLVIDDARAAARHDEELRQHRGTDPIVHADVARQLATRGARHARGRRRFATVRRVKIVRA